MATIDIKDLPSAIRASKSAVRKITQHGSRELALLYWRHVGRHGPYRTGYLVNSGMVSSPDAAVTPLPPGRYSRPSQRKPQAQLPKGKNKPGATIWVTHAPKTRGGGRSYAIHQRKKFQPQAHSHVLAAGPSAVQKVAEEEIQRLVRRLG